MSNLQIYTKNLNTYASFFDAIGDYESSDKCTQYLEKLSNVQNKNIRLSWSLTKTLGLDKPLNWLKQKGKEVDKWIRRNVPGGWVTFVVVAAGAGAFGPGVQGQLLDFFGKGGTIDQLLTSESPVDRALGQTIMNTAQNEIAKSNQPGQTRLNVQPGTQTPQTGQQSYPTLYQDVTQIVNQVKQDRNANIQQLIDTKKQAIKAFFKTDAAYGNNQANNFELTVKSTIKADPSLMNDSRVKGLK